MGASEDGAAFRYLTSDAEEPRAHMEKSLGIVKPKARVGGRQAGDMPNAAAACCRRLFMGIRVYDSPCPGVLGYFWKVTAIITLGEPGRTPGD